MTAARGIDGTSLTASEVFSRFPRDPISTIARSDDLAEPVQQ